MSSRATATETAEALIVEGGRSIRGALPVGGAKNASLPLLAATLLAAGTSRITNASVLRDVYAFTEILRALGCTVGFDPDRDPATPETITVDASTLSGHEPPEGPVRAMRASYYLLGALLARLGRARVALPGGDAWGPRPINLHVEGLRAFGAEVEVVSGPGGSAVEARTPAEGLPGGTFRLEPSSVGATINLLLAAATARGASRIENAAREPDAVALGEMLVAMGARITGLGTDVIEVEGVRRLQPATFRTPPDRIEAGTLMIAAAMAGTPGEPVRITHMEPAHLGAAFVEAFRATGAGLTFGADWAAVTPPVKIRPVSIETGIFPGFPTDLQAQWTAMMTRAAGPVDITDRVYADRWDHIPELQKMGAQITVDENTAHVEPGPLRGAAVEAADVRAGAALILAGLVAEGTTTVTGLHHLDRGYERLEQKLAAAGAAVHRTGENGRTDR